jgi:hypothetical protein
MPANQSPAPAQRRICWQCVREPYLRRLIQNTGTPHTCSYCGNKLPTFSIEEMADKIDKAFADFYQLTPSEPEGHDATLHHDPDIPWEWRREGDPVADAIEEAAMIDELPAEDIRKILAERHSTPPPDSCETERPFSVDSHYDLKDPDQGDLDAKWQDFATELKTQTRFFSQNATQMLDRIFEKLESLQTTEGKPVVASAGPDSGIATLHRARVFAGAEAELKEALCAPWKHLGSPPSSKACAGRMNAHGIAVFYGALDAKTALSEVRPPVGSRVTIAEFEIIRPLKLLDLAALREIDGDGSIFDPKTLPKQQNAGFLATLSKRLSAPVMPGDEASEYLTTQVVADYLANVASLDGIIFPSVQQAGTPSNVVLFHKAALVEEAKSGERYGATLRTNRPNGPRIDYRVWLKKPGPPTQDQRTTESTPPRLSCSTSNPDKRTPALAIKLDSIAIHYVTAARYEEEKGRGNWATR